jgi:predicted dehydrogenase
VPYYLNERITVDALKSGKHVLIEKPMALNYVQAQKIAEIAENFVMQ